jgi:hypothetical protein
MTLSNSEKTSLIAQHQRNNELNKYNLQLALVEENSVTAPNAETISSLNSQIADCDRKLAALAAELAEVEE